MTGVTMSKLTLKTHAQVLVSEDASEQMFHQ
jgi:hypothetical protein